MKILIVEDEPITRRLLQFTLTRWGYEAMTAVDGREAWEVLQRSTSPSLVISDWMMPGMDGLELCSRIRSRERPGYTYLIILTGRDRKEDIVKGLEAGADDYLVKPFDQEELLCRIRIGERIINLERRILQLANTDHLTGILNRRAFMERMEAELHRTSRHDQPLSLIITDIDHFKRINDQFGHVVGDRVLQQFVEAVATIIRPYDFLGRYGGEEFAIGLPGVNEQQAGEIAERIRREVAALDPAASDLPPGAHLTASFGAACLCREAGEQLQSLITRADDALYRAKREGRNRVSLAQEPCPEGGDYVTVKR